MGGGGASVPANGSFSVILTPPQTDGGALQVSLQDGSGNYSTSFVNAPDLTVRNAPANLAISNDGWTVTGTGEKGATVTIRTASNQIIRTGFVADNVSLPITVNAQHALQYTSHKAGLLLASGANSAYQIASNGNIPHIASAASLQSNGPVLGNAPANIIISADGSVLTGSRIRGGIVTVTNSSDSEIGNAQENPDGSFTVTLQPRQFSGDMLSVSMTNADGLALPSKNIQSPTLLVKAGPPTITNVESGNQSAQIIYTPPTTDEHSLITGFIAKAYRNDQIEGQASCDVDDTALTSSQVCPLTIESLTNGQEYQFVVSALHAQAEGEPSAPHTAAIRWSEIVAKDGDVPGMTGSATATLSGGGDHCSFQGNSGFGPADQQPDNTTVPHGQFQFTASPCPGTVTITLSYPEPLPEGIRFRKSDGQGAWFDPQDNATSLNLKLSENRRVVTYQITDDGLGDSAAQTPGVIVDPIVPVLVNSAPAEPHSVPTLSVWGLATLSALTALLGQGMRQRRTRRSTPRQRK